MAATQVTVISASERPGQILQSLRELWASRELLYALTMREVRVRYKQSLLGVAWAIIQPISLMVVFTVFFSWFAKMPSEGIPYPIFAFSALLPWTFFATSLSYAVPGLANNPQLITKVYFPREIFPLASVLAAGLDFLIACAVFAVMMVAYRMSVGLNVLYVVPLLAIQVLFTVAIAFILAGLNVYYRDVRHALPLVIQLWMYATPIVYPLSVVPEPYRLTYTLFNPMAAIIDGYRRVLVRGLPPEFVSFALAALTSVLLVLISYRAFKYMERSFADVV